MRSFESIKRLKISHLEFCLEKLNYKENEENQERVKQLYKKIYHIVHDMSELEARKALEIFRIGVNDELRKELKFFDIELTLY